MNGEKKINLARTSNAQNTCLHDVNIWAYKGALSQMISLFKLRAKSKLNWYKQF